MKRTRHLGVLVVLLLVGTLVTAATLEGLAQSEPGAGPDEAGRPGQVDLFGGSAYEGGYLKYSYKVSREGVDGYSITTTEIIPEDDGMYRIENSSTDVVPLSGVSLSFYGIGLRGLGFRIPTSSGGTVDLSPLSAIEDEALEPNREIVLPDGGFLAVGDAGVIAGLDVVYATYTHADFTNVQVNLAIPVDLAARNLLPLFPFLELEYQVDATADEGTEEPPLVMRSFSRIELTEFVREP